MWFALVVAVGIPFPTPRSLAATAQDEDSTVETVVEETVQTDITDCDLVTTDDENALEEVEPVVYDASIAREESRKGAEHLEALAAAEAAGIAYQAQLAEYFTEEEVIMLARTIDAEAGAVYPLCRRAAVGWTVVNRLDNGRWGPTTIGGIVSQPGQYAYYAYHGYSEVNYQIALDVLTRWADEHITGETNEGRILGPDYECFWGDGSQNHFYDTEGNYWDYSVDYDPYSNFEDA